jgi:predicted porin
MEIYRMKKSLFAVAAVTAFAGAAQAQSSVTVYGILDVGYIGSNAKEVAAPTAANAGSSVANTQTTKVQKNAFSSNAEQTSRLGFKGTEDLGGGKSAFFTVELGLQPANGNLSGGTATDAVQGTSQASGSAIDNRQSFVGLKQNGLGSLAFGRQYTPVFNSGAATSPGQYNNVVGDVVYAGSSSVNGSSTTFTSGNNNGIGYTNRASNAVTFQSDKFAGLGVNGMYAMNNQNATVLGSSSGGNTNWNGWGLSADFTWQKLYLTAAYQSFKTQVTGLDTYAAPTYNLAGAGALTAQSAASITTTGLAGFSMLSDKQTLVGGSYDFGILKAYAQWAGRKVQQDSSLTTAGAAGTAGNQMNRTAQQIGVRSFVTPTIETWASIGSGKYKGAIASTGEPGSVNFVGWQLGSNYLLSKRTNLYAIYGQTQSTSPTVSTAGSGASANQYAVGVRHTF